MAKSEGIKLIANNKKAYHDYFIDEKYEAGIALHGTEVKSLRMGRCSIKESFVTISNKGEILINHMHISPYEKGNIFNKDPLRVRKLLLHKSEINKLAGQIKMKGYTLMPLKVYFKGSLVKVLHAVRNCMIRDRISRKRTQNERRKETLKSGIWVKSLFSAGKGDAVKERRAPIFVTLSL